MSFLRRLLSGAADDRGAVLVTVALFMPVAILFVALAIDASNAWWHKRHLQVQADAAALAAAYNADGCFSVLTALATDQTMYKVAGQYGGVGSVTVPGGISIGSASPLYNTQIGSTTSANMHELINSTTFYNQSSTTNPGTPDDTTTTDPCTSMEIDVKMTETNLPWYMKIFSSGFNGVPFIDARARVQILQQDSIGPGALPVSVNDPEFKSAYAYFINESTGTQIGSSPLTAQGTTNGLQIWSSSASPYSLTVPTGAGSDVGVRIALSGATNLTGTMSTDCAKGGVVCYDNTSGTSQLLDVHGWSSAGTGTITAPIARSVVLTPSTCSDQYFTNSAANCTDSISATIDFGANPSFNGVAVKANGSALACTNTQPAVCTGTVAVTAAGGLQSVTITSKKGNATTTFSNVQSVYAAGTPSGPIQTAGLYEGALGDTSSLKQGTVHNLVVSIGVSGNLQVATSTSSPIFTMRFDGTGSQNQSVACTPVNGGSTFADALATGCTGGYQINQALTCPDTNTPIDCISPATGNKQNQVAKGINLRVLGSTKPSTCTSPNHWSNYPNISPSDPRVVDVFVTPYGSFQGNGGSVQFPIENFSAFYITGWQDNGNGFNNPCQGNGDDTAQPGTIVGHFINYVNTLGNGNNNGHTCVVGALGLCEAVLTR
jgi:hypothetical protein